MCSSNVQELQKKQYGIIVFIRLLDGTSKRLIPRSLLILFPSSRKTFTSSFNLRDQLHKAT